MGLSRIPFPRQAAISVENRNFSPPRVFNASVEGVPLGILQRRNAKKTRVIVYHLSRILLRPPRREGMFSLCLSVVYLYVNNFTTDRIFRSENSSMECLPLRDTAKSVS